MTDFYEMSIPFQGFYESLWDLQQDSAIESMFENDSGELNQEAFDSAYNSANWAQCRKAIAKQYTAELEAKIQEELPNFSMEFVELESPTFYNYSTDQISVKLPAESVVALIQACRPSALQAVLIDRHTHRSGFVSSYSNKLSDWLEKPFSEWDSVEVESLSLAAFNCLGLDVAETERAICLYEMGEFIYQSVEDCIDWETLEKKGLIQ